MFVTRRPRGAKPQVKGAQGPTDRPNPMAGRPHFESVQAETWQLIHMSVHKSILYSRVSGNWEEWPIGHVDGRPTIHHLQTNSIKSMEGPLDLYIRILMVEFTHTTVFL
jgi:hypothetical protein